MGQEERVTKSGLVTLNLSLDLQQSRELKHLGNITCSTRCFWDRIFYSICSSSVILPLILYFCHFRMKLTANGLPFIKNIPSLPKVFHCKKFRILQSSFNCRSFSKMGHQCSQQKRANEYVNILALISRVEISGNSKHSYHPWLLPLSAKSGMLTLKRALGLESF